MNKEPGKSKIHKLIDEILWKDWDPIGVNDIPSARDEYQRWLITSLKYPVQAHQAFNDLKSLQNSHRAFKSILEYEDACTKRNRPAPGASKMAAFPCAFKIRG